MSPGALRAWQIVLLVCSGLMIVGGIGGAIYFQELGWIIYTVLGAALMPVAVINLRRSRKSSNSRASVSSPSGLDRFRSASHDAE